MSLIRDPLSQNYSDDISEAEYLFQKSLEKKKSKIPGLEEKLSSKEKRLDELLEESTTPYNALRKALLSTEIKVIKTKLDYYRDTCEQYLKD